MHTPYKLEMNFGYLVRLTTSDSFTDLVVLCFEKTIIVDTKCEVGDT